MSQHPNARLTPRGRELLASRVAGGERVSAVARQIGVSRQTASKWLSAADVARAVLLSVFEITVLRFVLDVTRMRASLVRRGAPMHWETVTRKKL